MQELIAKYFEGTITVEERKQLFDAMEHDTDLKREFISIKSVSGLVSWLPSHHDTPEAIGKLLDFKKSRQKKNSSFFTPWIITGYAATACIAILATWFIMTCMPGKQKEAEALAYEQISTPAGQRVCVTLHDGTVVWLNAHSTLRYPNRFDKRIRKVELDGEAFFEVKHDVGKPFIVSTDKASIRVTGTKFNVFAYRESSDFSASLVEGSVSVFTAGQSVRLCPHEIARLVGKRFVKSQYTNSDFLLWKEGIYSFDDVPFNDIVKKLELYYDIRIEQNNRNLSGFRFSGKFRQRDGIVSVLKTMQKVHYFAFRKDDELNKITIR